MDCLKHVWHCVVSFNQTIMQILNYLVLISIWLCAPKCSMHFLYSFYNKSALYWETAYNRETEMYSLKRNTENIVGKVPPAPVRRVDISNCTLQALPSYHFTCFTFLFFRHVFLFIWVFIPLHFPSNVCIEMLYLCPAMFTYLLCPSQKELPNLLCMGVLFFLMARIFLTDWWINLKANMLADHKDWITCQAFTE